MNKNERMNKLNNAGIDTGNYFTLEVPEGIPAGAKIHVIIDENGVARPIVKNDVVLEQIIKDGYVRNTKLHRRFVMAQMFQMLNYVSWDGESKGYNDCLNRQYDYHYTLKMMKEEVRVLSKLEVRDKETFEERTTFFNKPVIVSVLGDYLGKLVEYINKMPSKNCKGVPYKRIKGVNIFVEDLDKKVYAPIRERIRKIEYATSYAKIYAELDQFMNHMIKLPYNTPKSKVWIDTYKGEGAYYTCKNLIMFHNCYVYTPTGAMCNTAQSMAILNRKLDEYQGEGWRMFAFMKKLISDNRFDFNKAMDRIYN